MLKLFRSDTKSPLTRLHLIREGEQPAIDIVFMHGLDGDAYKTWGFNSEPSWCTWIAEKFPNISIWSLEYRIRSSWWFGGAMPLYDRAVNVLATVSSELTSNTKVIVICHSYGGLLAKEMVRAALEAAPEYGLFANRIAGFVFLGTPQNGSAIPQYVAALTASAPPIAHAFPAMLQGGLVTPVEMPPADTPVGEMYEKLRREPTVENFLAFMQVVYVFGFHPDARESALKVVQLLRAEIAATPPEYAQAALDLAAFIAARNRDVELADTVAIVSIERLVATRDVDRLLPTASVIVECAAAAADRKEALVTLARRLENLAFVAPAESLPEALDIFRILQSINEDLSPLLGRAIAAARVGIPTISGS